MKYQPYANAWTAYGQVTTNAAYWQPTVQIIPALPTAASSTPPKEKPMPTDEIRGGAPTKTLFAEYVATKGGYRGQVRWGDPTVRNAEADVLWEGQIVRVKDGEVGKAKTAALKSAEDALAKAIARLFE